MTTQRIIPVNVSITIEGAVSDGAEGRIGDAITRYSDELAAKVREIERNDRAIGADNPEVTASTVIKAEAEMRERNVRSRLSPLDVALRITVPLSSSAAGVLGSYLNSLLQAALFGGVTAVAVITTCILVFRGGK